jgi:alpha-ribazole phosphatase
LITHLVAEPVPSEDGLIFWIGLMMARQLLFVRHAQIAPQYAGRYVGRTDVPLARHGVQQAEKLVALLRSRKPERCVCSPLLRARQTAEVLCEPIGLPVEVDEDLREIDFGHWEGRTFAEIAALDSAAVARWAELSDDFAFPGGESVGGFFTRVGRVADRLAAGPTRVVLVVAHGGVIRGSVCHFLGLPPRHYLRFDVRHATCTTVDLMEGRGVLTGLNEQCDSERV